MATPQTPRQRKRRMNADMNVVPYIDVMLVLMVIFMVTAPLLTQGIDVELPEVAAESMTIGDEPVILSVDREGALYLSIGENYNNALSDDDITRLAASTVKNNPEKMFLIEADAAADYQFVAKGMSLLQAAGVSHIGFVTDPVTVEAGNRR